MADKIEKDRGDGTGKRVLYGAGTAVAANTAAGLYGIPVIKRLMKPDKDPSAGGRFADKVKDVAKKKGFNVNVNSAPGLGNSGYLNKRDTTRELRKTFGKTGGEFFSSGFPDDGQIVLGNSSKTIAAHELGHAINDKQIRKTKAGRALSRVGSELRKNGRLPVGSAVSAGIAASRKDPDSTTAKVATYAPLAAAAPILTGEFNASRRGLKTFGKDLGVKPGIKPKLKLAAALSTYAAVPAAATGAALLARKHRRDQLRKQESIMIHPEDIDAFLDECADLLGEGYQGLSKSERKQRTKKRRKAKSSEQKKVLRKRRKAYKRNRARILKQQARWRRKNQDKSDRRSLSSEGEGVADSHDTEANNKENMMSLSFRDALALTEQGIDPNAIAESVYRDDPGILGHAQFGAASRLTEGQRLDIENYAEAFLAAVEGDGDLSGHEAVIDGMEPSVFEHFVSVLPEDVSEALVQEFMQGTRALFGAGRNIARSGGTWNTLKTMTGPGAARMKLGYGAQKVGSHIARNKLAYGAGAAALGGGYVGSRIGRREDHATDAGMMEAGRFRAALDAIKNLPGRVKGAFSKWGKDYKDARSGKRIPASWGPKGNTVKSAGGQSRLAAALDAIKQNKAVTAAVGGTALAGAGGGTYLATRK